MISTEGAGNCRLTELVVDGVLVGHALENRDGPLSKLISGRYDATVSYFPPGTMLISRQGANLDEILKVELTQEGTPANAAATAAQYRASGGRGLAYDLSLALEIEPDKCDRRVSSISSPKDAWQTTPLFKTLFPGKTPGAIPAAGFTTSVTLELRRPEVIEFRDGSHSFRRLQTYWEEWESDTHVATYDEFGRNLAGFDVRDRQSAQTLLFGRLISVPRILHIPSGFKFFFGDEVAGARHGIETYRPNAELILIARRSERTHQQSVVTAKSFIRRIVIDDLKVGDRISDTISRRLGFEDLVGGRVAALELALATDAMFSESPTTRAKERSDYRLWSELLSDVECEGDTIASFKETGPSVGFGREGPLQAEGKLITPTVIAANGDTGATRSVTVHYTVMGRPNIIALPAFNAVKPRSCSWIWHEVNIQLTCLDGQLNTTATIAGSKFPSHSIWVNEDKVVDVEQSAFDRLWVCQKISPDTVE